MAEYAHPESAVTTQWVSEHGSDPNVRLVEVDVDTTAYEQGHVAGAVGWNWKSQLQQTVSRDLVSKADLEQLLGQSGIDNNTTIILYGDNNNWFAAWAFWQLKYHGHGDVKLMNGGRARWSAENRPLTTDVPSHASKSYTAGEPNENIRAYRDDVLAKVRAGNVALVDVRAPAEFSGELLAPENLPQEGSQRGGHIPRSGQRPLGHRCTGRRHLQVCRRPPVRIRGQGYRRQQGDHRLLPHRRALLPHLVCADPAPGPQQRPQLRWLLDRVGQHRGSSHREALAATAGSCLDGSPGLDVSPSPGHRSLLQDPDSAVLLSLEDVDGCDVPGARALGQPHLGVPHLSPPGLAA